MGGGCGGGGGGLHPDQDKIQFLWVPEDLAQELAALGWIVCAVGTLADKPTNVCDEGEWGLISRISIMIASMPCLQRRPATHSRLYENIVGASSFVQRGVYLGPPWVERA